MIAERDRLVGAILSFLSSEDLLTLDDIRAALEAQVTRAGEIALAALRARLVSSDEGVYAPRDVLAQQIHHLLADKLMLPESGLTGRDHIRAVAGQRVIICANHLSYSDVNLLEILIHRAGEDDLADRLTAIAGPKVFTSRARRFSSLCFGTIKTAQSAEVASDDAVMNPRAIARASRLAIETALDRLRLGDAIVLFGEGSRSRTGQMQRILPAVARYFDDDDAWVMPVGLTGTEALFPVDATGIRRVRVTVHVGRPVRARDLRERALNDRRLMVDAIGCAIADLLPEHYRGVYATGIPEVETARRLLAAL